MKSRTFSISERLAKSGQSFTGGFEIGWKISSLPASVLDRAATVMTEWLPRAIALALPFHFGVGVETALRMGPRHCVCRAFIVGGKAVLALLIDRAERMDDGVAAETAYM
jgi:hypothetical protein